MYIKAPENADINDAVVDLETALAIARGAYSLYFEEEGNGAEMYFASNRDSIQHILGAVIDYIRSAKCVLEAVEPS